MYGQESTRHTKIKGSLLGEATQKAVLYPVQVPCVLRLVPCTHQDDIRLRAKHSAIKADQFLLSLFVFDPSFYTGLYALAERKPHLSQSLIGKCREGIAGGREVESLWPFRHLANCLFRNVVTSLWMDIYVCLLVARERSYQFAPNVVCLCLDTGRGFKNVETPKHFPEFESW
jgi:hypothetical protein